MRHFQLPSTDPVFQQESLQLLTDMLAAYEPALVPELRDYVAAQAGFIVEQASEYRSSASNWQALLMAGQRAVVNIWQEHQAKQGKSPFSVRGEVMDIIRTAAASQLSGQTTPENLISWAREAGEDEAIAVAFAKYHQTESAGYEQDMAEETAKLKAKMVTEEARATEIEEDLAEVAKSIAEIPATVLSRAWAYIIKYKEALRKGHSPEWANVYAKHFGLTDNESHSEEEAYHQLSNNHPNPKTAPRDLSAGAIRYPFAEWVNQVVYQEAYAVRLDRGAEYADAYAREVGLGNYETAEAYAEAFVKMRRKGKSELYASYYAYEVTSDTDPKYAALEAEIYEQALADGMDDYWARRYADHLSTNLIEYAKTEDDKDYYTQEAAEYIAKLQREAQAQRDRKTEEGA